MKKLLFLFLFPLFLAAQSTLITPGVNSPNIVTNSVTNGGITPPRMTSSQILAISIPIKGTMVYDTDTNCMRVYNGTNWDCITEATNRIVSGYNQYCVGNDQGNDIIAKGDYVYVVGQFTGSISFITFPTTTFSSLGETDAFVAKFHKDGSCVWAKHIKNSGRAEAMALAMDQYNNLYVAGNFTGNISFDTFTYTGFGNMDVFVCSYDNAGNKNWQAVKGGVAKDSLTDVAADTNGNLFITGSYSGTVSFVPGIPATTAIGGEDIFLVSITTNFGIFSGVKTGGTLLNDIGKCIYIDSNNNIFFGAFSTDAITFDGFATGGGFVCQINSSFTTTEVYNTIPPTSIEKDAEGNFYILYAEFSLGGFGLPLTFFPFVTIFKYSPSFTKIWEVSNNYYSGYRGPTGTDDYNLSNFSIGYHFKTGFTKDLNNNIVISGCFTSYTLFGYKYPLIGNSTISYAKAVDFTDIFVMKINTNGELLWNHTQGGIGDNRSGAVSVNESGEIFATGFFSGTHNFGSNPVINNGGKDMFIMKIVD